MQTLTSAAEAAAWLRSRVVTGTLRTDSRAVQPGDALLAWPGRAHDARTHVGAALAKGASACLVEAEGVQEAVEKAVEKAADERIAALPSLKAAAGEVADAFFGAPSTQLDVIATTGTNGKTSTAWWTAQALTRLGRRCGVVGTLGVGEPPDDLHDTGLTTPDAVSLHAAFRRFADRGFAACAIEASSIGLAEHRLAGARIAVALFSNLTRDHLDYHGDMVAYWAAKRTLFSWPGLRAAGVNVDDEHGALLAAELSGSSLDLWTVSLVRPARLQARGLAYFDGGLGFDAVEGDERQPVRSRLVGVFNAANLLLVLAGLRALGVPLADAAAVVPHLSPVPGRMQRVHGAGIEVVVDYAHTPDALDKVLQALRPLAAARGSRLWCVFGCGGNRDATKRPLMGAIAARRADRVVVTSDNPRDEAPDAILAQILAGADAIGGHHEVDVFEDRRAAIAHALREAAPGDVVLLAGKGHEAYQEIAGVRRPFSDLEEARAALARRAGAGA
jgi:UDP-N-acetylmuramoyl-L-alanyl-D-glutamate--2,6-diaminopimelate ligase